MSNEVILEVKDLKIHFQTEYGIAKAVDGVSYSVRKGETLGIVGESGCGKSITSLAILQLVPNPPGIIAGGQILYRGKDLLKFSDRQIRNIRGNKISMIFQEPMTALNPILTVGDQISEVIVRHLNKTKKEAFDRALHLLEEVGIPSPEARIHEYPHQLSGGMKQRVMIAMALACEPDILIADEPTTALDVTVQAQILDLLRKMQKEHGMAIILITHDLGVIAEMANDVVVMYAGKVVENAPATDLYQKRFHPYTKGLFDAIPNILVHKERLEIIEGVVPNPLDFPEGCRFSTRCEWVEERCHSQDPALIEIEPGHKTACHLVKPKNT